MKFHFKAQNTNNEIIEGEMDALDKFELARKLKAEQKTVLFAEEKKTRSLRDIELPPWLQFGISMHEKIVFTRNLGAMLTAGLPLARALGVFEKQTKNPRLKNIYQSLSLDISRGRSLSESMKTHPDFFSPLAVAMVRAGEESGNLPEALKVVSTLLEKSYQLKRRVKGAMMYPTIVLCALVGVGTLMFIYVIPTLTATFKELQVPLPYSTQIIITVSDFFAEHTLFALLLMLSFLVGGYVFARMPYGKRLLEILFLKTPIIGDMIKEYNSAQTARTLSSLLSAGVSMVSAISITRDVLQNSQYRNVFDEALVRVEKGAVLSQVFLSHTNIYPVLVSEMTAVGEETGKVSEMLTRLAVFYEEEVDQKTKDLSTVVEPFLMVVIGCVVGFFAISVITPLYSVMTGI